MTASLRSTLSAGLAAGLVVAGTGAVAAAPGPTMSLQTIASPAVELSALVSANVTANVAGPETSPGDVLINAYYAVQPWVQYGFELGAWAFSWLPWPIGLLGPQINIAYSGIQPLTEAVVFSLAFLIDGQFDLIGPTLVGGIQTAVNNVVAGEIDWVLSFFPPLPPLPFPIFPVAATASLRTAGEARRAAATRAPLAEVPATDTATEAPADVDLPEPPATEAADVPVDTVTPPVDTAAPADATAPVAVSQPRRPAHRGPARATAARAAGSAAAVTDAADAAVTETADAAVAKAEASPSRNGARTTDTRAPRVGRSAR